jgi:hypothetical protein
MSKSKTITIRVPIENYYEYLKNAATERKPISTYINDVLYRYVTKKGEKGILIENKAPIPATIPVQKIEQKTNTIIPKIDTDISNKKADVITNVKVGHEKPKPKVYTPAPPPKAPDDWIHTFHKSKWVYIEAPLSKGGTVQLYSKEKTEEWRAKREWAFNKQQYSFQFYSDIYDTFTGKEV